MEITKFDREFVERTKSIVNDYDGGYEFSNLLNCTLGLIVLPFEILRSDSSPYWSQEIGYISDFPKFTVHIFEPIWKLDRTTRKPIPSPKTLKVLLRKVRNGIAHQNIAPSNHEGVFQSVRIWNTFAQKRDVDIEFTQNELRLFAMFIADAYLNTSSEG